jgi:hypothetical protein
MNPHGLFRSPVIDGLNVMKPKMGFYERQLKAYQASRLKPGALVLGNSRSDVGLDPMHPGWSAEPAYNLGLGQASAYTVYRYFLHADSFRQLEQVVIGIDFEMFRPGILEDPADQNLALAVDGNGKRNPNFFGLLLFQALTSADAFLNAVEVFQTNLKARGTVEADNYVPAIGVNGMMRPDSFGLSSYKTRHGMFLASLGAFVNIWWAPLEEYRGFLRADTEPGAIYFRKFLAAAYERGVDLRMVISPTHAYLNEALAAAGLWGAMERWKRMVVRINEEEAARANSEPFPVWDFSGYNRITTEMVPKTRNQPNDMSGYWDISHFRKGVGDQMLDRVFAVSEESRAGFGVLLTGVNLEDHLASIRRKRVSYREANPELVTEIEARMQGLLTE